MTSRTPSLGHRSAPKRRLFVMRVHFWVICCLSFCSSRCCCFFLRFLADQGPVQRAKYHEIHVTVVRNQGCTVFEKGSFRCHFGRHLEPLLESLRHHIGTQSPQNRFLEGSGTSMKKTSKKRLAVAGCDWVLRSPKGRISEERIEGKIADSRPAAPG